MKQWIMKRDSPLQALRGQVTTAAVHLLNIPLSSCIDEGGGDVSRAS